jgi:catechol-2,3-dioxygenase
MTTATNTTRFHLSLNVRDLSESVAFYRDLLDTAPSKLRERFARFTTDAPPLVLSLVEQEAEAAPAGAQRLSHLGFRLASPEQLDAARRRLAATGRPLREEHESRCCYALQNKFWVTDPDGNEWEFYELLEDLETIGQDSKGCCA